MNETLKNKISIYKNANLYEMGPICDVDLLHSTVQLQRTNGLGRV
jgi:hypothetical protein